MNSPGEAGHSPSVRLSATKTLITLLCCTVTPSVRSVPTSCKLYQPHSARCFSVSTQPTSPSMGLRGMTSYQSPFRTRISQS